MIADESALKQERLARRRAAYAAMGDEEKARRRSQEKARKAMRIALETPEERERRLARGRELSRRNRLHETPEQRQRRLEYLREYKRHYASKNASSISERSRAYYVKNKERIRLSCKAYRQRHRGKVNERNRMKRLNDKQFAIASRLRHRVYLAVRSASARKHGRTLEMAGCTTQFLCEWLESQFAEGMSWGNMGEWHIDHIIPCAAFDLADSHQQLVAFHYTNLRPLWGKENAAKRDNLPVAYRERWTLGCVARARAALGIPLHVAEPA